MEVEEGKNIKIQDLTVGIHDEDDVPMNSTTLKHKRSQQIPSGVGLWGKIKWWWTHDHEDNPHFKIYFLEAFFLILCVIFSVIMLASVIKLFTDAPFEPLFWAYCFSMIGYWITAFILMYVWYWSSQITLKTFFKRSLFYLFLFSVIISFICLMMVLYLCFPESFESTAMAEMVQLRSVTASSAVFFLRFPLQPVNVRIVYRNGTHGVHSSLPVNFSAAMDFTNMITLDNLAANTTYLWSLSNDNTTFGEFKTHPSTGTPSKFTFYIGSCFLLLDRLYAQDNSGGFQFLYEELKPDLFTFVGDFIYSDIPFFQSDSRERYWSLYRRSLVNINVQNLLRSTPSYFMWDDHEVANDFPNVISSNMFRITPATFDNAFDNAWQFFLGLGNPKPFPTKSYFKFDYGDSSFFVVDVRMYRNSSSLLGSEQLADLKQWLSVPISGFKFILSPVGFTNDFPSVKDSWGGVLLERNDIFAHIRTNNIPRTLFLSGDSHFAHVNELQGKTNSTGLFEMSTSPIGAFGATLGGLFSNVMFKPEEEREDRILFETQGTGSMVSILGFIRVDTTLPVPEAVLEIWDGKVKVFSKTYKEDKLI